MTNTQKDTVTIGIDGRLINETGVGRYTKNLYSELGKLESNVKFELFQPKIHWHSVAEQILLLFWLIAKKYNLVHFTYFSFPVFYPGKFIATVHDLIPWHFKTGKASTLPLWLYETKHLFYKLLLTIGLRRATKIIAVSFGTKPDLVKTLKINPDKIEVVYEGVDSKFQNPNSKLPTYAKATAGKQINAKFANIKYLLYVGNAYPHKNLERLIEAMNIVDSKVKLVLVGPQDFFYRQLMQNGSVKQLKDRIIFWGQATDEELAALYQSAAALVNPSFSEGFGLPGLEALASGCPVVCSNIPVFKEIYGDCALFFDPSDSKAIAYKIKLLLQMPSAKKEEICSKGKLLCRNFSWEKMAEKTLAVYREVLAR